MTAPIDDINDEGNQFAMAKAIASGDARLMQKAGLEAELARLERLSAAHYDDQFAVRRAIQSAERTIERNIRLIEDLGEDLKRRLSTRGEDFAFRSPKGTRSERDKAGDYLLPQARLVEKTATEGRWDLGEIGGFQIVLEG